MHDQMINQVRITKIHHNLSDKTHVCYLYIIVSVLTVSSSYSLAFSSNNKT